jgi:hypothetical protein
MTEVLEARLACENSYEDTWATTVRYVSQLQNDYDPIGYGPHFRCTVSRLTVSLLCPASDE